MNIRLLVCVPTGKGIWSAAFGWSLVRAVNHFATSEYEGGTKKLEVKLRTSSRLTENRNSFIHDGIEMDATHLMMLDDDMVFPPDTFIRLLQHNKMVVGCNYPRKNFTGVTTGFKYTSPEDEHMRRTGDVLRQGHGLEQVGHLGAGMLLVRMDVFEHIEAPWFAEPVIEGTLMGVGEDVYFCRKLEKAGIPLWCDHDLSWLIAHEGSFDYTMQIAEICHEQHSMASMLGKSASPVLGWR